MISHYVWDINIYGGQIGKSIIGKLVVYIWSRKDVSELINAA